MQMKHIMIEMKAAQSLDDLSTLANNIEIATDSNTLDVTDVEYLDILGLFRERTEHIRGSCKGLYH